MTLLVAASCLSIHSVHFESEHISKLSDCKVHQWEDFLWKEQPGGVAVKIFPWIRNYSFVSSNCNISAVCKLQRNKNTVIQHSITAHLKYNIICIFVLYPDDAEANGTCWWMVIYDNTYFIDVIYWSITNLKHKWKIYRNIFNWC